MKTERLDLRLTKDVKNFIQYAADLQGRTLSDFAVSAIYQAATEAIDKHHSIKLSLHDQQAFVDALEAKAPLAIVTNSPEINALLKKRLNVHYLNTKEMKYTEVVNYLQRLTFNARILVFTTDFNFEMPSMEFIHDSKVWKLPDPTLEELNEKIKEFEHGA